MESSPKLESATVSTRERTKVPIILLVSRQAVVHQTVKSLKWKRNKPGGASLPSFDIGWIETADLRFYRQIRPHQRVSQAPGMEELSKKKNLCRNLNAMRSIYPDDYDIFPKSWLIPEEYPSLIKFMKSHSNSVMIVKPDGRCQGRGIYLTSTYEEIDPRENQVCQLYIERPFLINGFKFDLRLYALITSFDPLRVFLYDNGLARFCTQPYKVPCSQNFSSSFMHLTNYAINKTNGSYCFNKDGCTNDKDSKWTVKTFFQWLASRKTGFSIASIWSSIQQVIAKAIIAGSAPLRHQYRVHYPMPNNGAMSFQLLGVDILLDENLRPWLIEMNRNPSLKCDTSLDHNVKSAMLRDLFAIVVPEMRTSAFPKTISNSASGDKMAGVARQLNLEKQRALDGGFQMILPTDTPEGLQHCPYVRFISENQKNFEARTKKIRRREASKHTWI